MHVSLSLMSIHYDAVTEGILRYFLQTEIHWPSNVEPPLLPCITQLHMYSLFTVLDFCYTIKIIKACLGCLSPLNLLKQSGGISLYIRKKKVKLISSYMKSAIHTINLICSILYFVLTTCKLDNHRIRTLLGSVRFSGLLNFYNFNSKSLLDTKTP